MGEGGCQYTEGNWAQTVGAKIGQEWDELFSFFTSFYEYNTVLVVNLYPELGHRRSLGHLLLCPLCW